MRLRTRLLRAVSTDCGPASKNVLRGIAKACGKQTEFDTTFRAMLAAGELVMHGTRKGAVYGANHKPRRSP